MNKGGIEREFVRSLGLFIRDFGDIVGFRVVGIWVGGYVLYVFRLKLERLEGLSFRSFYGVKCCLL